MWISRNNLKCNASQSVDQFDSESKLNQDNQDSQNQMMNRIDSESNENCHHCHHHRITGVARWHWPARIWELSARSTPPDTIGLLDHHVIVTSWQNGAVESVESVESHCLYENHEHHETSKRKVISGCWASSTFFFSCNVKPSNIVKPSTLGGSFSACLDAGQRLRATQNDAETTPQRRNAICAACCAWTLDSAVSAAFISWHTKSKPVSHGKQM